MKRSPFFQKQIEALILDKLKQLPLVGSYAKTRGWPFVLAWVHRISGILLALYLWFHIATLTILTTPAAFDDKMKSFQLFIFAVLEWALALPVILHALNGGRLLWYEIYDNRNDKLTLRWVWSLSTIYVLLIGLLMLLGDQNVSPVFFWLCMLLISACLTYLIASKIWHTQNAPGWKLQRITGAFLLIMVPAHFLFMHLQPSIGHDAGIIIARMRHIFIKIIDLALILGGLYHAGYGLLAIANDYLSARLIQFIWAALVMIVMAAFTWAGIQLTLFI